MPWGRGRPGWLVGTFGRRGVFLLMFGTIYLIIAANLILVPIPRFADVAVVGALLDSPLWAGMWLVGGGLSVGYGLARSRRVHDEAGFVGLLVPPAVWTIFYGASFLSWAVTQGQFGSVRSLSGVAAWSIAWTVVLLISGWPEVESGIGEQAG